VIWIVRDSGESLRSGGPGPPPPLAPALLKSVTNATTLGNFKSILLLQQQTVDVESRLILSSQALKLNVVSFVIFSKVSSTKATEKKTSTSKIFILKVFFSEVELTKVQL